ncbi:succinylglutamate desuccinylase/aspartoacylase family protein [Halorubrum rutilum]|uniref:Succinylglutamate desuccinylase/aspartoacylase family protein n=1 Tax=Halorubrum rutilum TaxID=1364933 RepID=A0ABD6AI00_9EURY|nr:succinylglutamate desuccinylase/aspartoacylase family protein [Halorubrum rutilum]
MRVEVLGTWETTDTPPVAVVGAIHGDEPCGARAIERFLTSAFVETIRRPVKLIIANERALAAGTRYVDADLNRSFPGTADSDVHEEQLAADLLEEIAGCVTLGFHSTVSFAEPFGTLADPTPLKATIMEALPLAHAADFSGVVDGRSVNLPRFVNVEAGYQGSDTAAENAYECLLAFLRVMDVLPGEVPSTPTTHYLVQDAIHKATDQTYRVHVDNFERVAAGNVFATTTAGEELVADEEFWPVLLSATGHDVLLGYRSIRLGKLGDASS